MSGMTRRGIFRHFSATLAALAFRDVDAKRRHKKRKDKRKRDKPATTPTPVPCDHWRPGRLVTVSAARSPLWTLAAHATCERWAARFDAVTLRYTGEPDADIQIVPSSADDLYGHRGGVICTHGPDGYYDACEVRVDDGYYNALPADDHARFALMCHELGHSLGADHSPAGTGGCMAADRVAQGDPVLPSAWTLQTLIDSYTACPPPLGDALPKKKRSGR